MYSYVVHNAHHPHTSHKCTQRADAKRRIEHMHKHPVADSQRAFKMHAITLTPMCEKVGNRVNPIRACCHEYSTKCYVL